MKIFPSYAEIYEGDCLISVSGPISGPGNVTIDCGWKSHTRGALLNAHNTYTGFTFFDHENTLHPATILGYPGSVPNYASVTCNYGYVNLEVGDNDDRWTLPEAYRFAAQATFLNSATTCLTGDFSTNGCGRLSVTPPTDVNTQSYWLETEPSNTIDFVANDNLAPYHFNWRAGTARFRGPKKLYLGETKIKMRESAAASSSVRFEDDVQVTLEVTNDVAIGTYGGAPSRMVVSNASWCVSDPQKVAFDASGTWTCVAGGRLGVGGDGPGILEVLDGALVSNRLQVTQYGTGGPWKSSAMGAVYQRGGEVVALGCNNSLGNSGIGMGQTYNGYYEITGGKLISRGRFDVGQYGIGIFVQEGGEVLVTNRLDQTKIDSASGVAIATGNGGSGQIYIRNGTFLSHNGDCYFGSAGVGAPLISLTVEGATGLFDADTHIIRLANGSHNGRYYINLNDGATCSCGTIYRQNLAKTNNLFCVNFNGGIYKPRRWAYCFASDEGTGGPTNVMVYAGGMTIDMSDDHYASSTIKAPVRGAWGKGVSGIALPAPIKNKACVGPVTIEIVGDGVGASARAHFDSVAGQIDRIDVTSAGSGYTHATVKYIYSSGWGTTPNSFPELSTENGAITLADNANTGSFTLKGTANHVLTLESGSNTWGGATIVDTARLKMNADYGLPENTALRLLGGGQLDLANHVTKITSVEYGVGGGAILNASAADIPLKRTIAISTADILSGKAVAFSEDVNFANCDIVITGDWSGLTAKNGKYAFVTTTGTFTGKAVPTDMTALPPGWQMRTSGNKVVLSYAYATTLIVR